MTRQVVPSWQCDKCAKCTPHGKYTCQHCGAKQPNYPELFMRAPDGSIPPPEEKKPDKGTRPAPQDMRELLRDSGYDEGIRDE